MAIPRQEEMWRPGLAALGDGLNHPSDDIRRAVREHFGLTDDEVNRPRPSGVGTVFGNTVDFALVDLQLKGPSPWLIEKVKDRVYRITDRGKDVLAKHETFDDEVLAGLKKERASKERASASTAAPGITLERTGAGTTAVQTAPAATDFALAAIRSAAERHRLVIPDDIYAASLFGVECPPTRLHGPGARRRRSPATSPAVSRVDGSSTAGADRMPEPEGLRQAA